MPSMPKIPLRAVAYARFSSELQRDESIDAQLREIKAHAKKEGMLLTSEYIDRAKSATTDQRPEFQRMIEDSSKDKFDVIIVHKLDRFARSRYDSAHYKYLLKRNGIKLCSVTENIDGSPESIVLESVLEGMAEYYSKNLAREVEKGKRENALKGKHVGGTPPLGYDLDRNKLTLIINEREAEAVKLIFSLYLKGYGYGEIISKLNINGYKTKRGKAFGKGSLYEILRNEKYTGIYTYGKSASKNAEGKYNRHKYKDLSEIIRLEDAVPQIISKDDFRLVQEKMNTRKHKAAKYTAKQEYLLSGKIICGDCGSYYVGNSRKPRPDHPLYVSYRCSKKHGAAKCTNPEINKEVIEGEMLRRLSNTLFNEAVLPKLIKAYKDYYLMQNSNANQERTNVELQLKEINKGINNIVSIITESGSSALMEKLLSLEKEKTQLNERLAELVQKLDREEIDQDKIFTAFKKAKEMLKNGTLENRREIIEQYIDKIIIFKDRIDIKFNFSEEFIIDETVCRTKN